MQRNGNSKIVGKFFGCHWDALEMKLEVLGIKPASRMHKTCFKENSELL